MVSAPEKPEPSEPPDSSESTRASRGASPAPGAILRATGAILLEEGFCGVTIRKVAERSGYTAPTLYHHFGDKRGLLRALLEERFRDVHAVMRAIPPGDDPALHLREMARAFVGFALANPDHYRLLTMPLDGEQPGEEEVPSAEAARNLVKGALEELAREGTLATPDVEAAFQVTWALLHGLIALQLIRPHYEFADDLAELAFDAIERGLLRTRRESR